MGLIFPFFFPFESLFFFCSLLPSLEANSWVFLTGRLNNAFNGASAFSYVLFLSSYFHFHFSFFSKCHLV